MGKLNMSQKVLVSLLVNEPFHSHPNIDGEINWQEVFQNSIAQYVRVLAY